MPWYAGSPQLYFSNRLVSEGAWGNSVIFCHNGTHLTIHDEVRDEG
jgi:hypothetical protein